MRISEAWNKPRCACHAAARLGDERALTPFVTRHSTGAVQQIKDEYEPGTALGFDPLGLLRGKSEEDINEMKTKELNNGRLGAKKKTLAA